MHMVRAGKVGIYSSATSGCLLLELPLRHWISTRKGSRTEYLQQVYRPT